MTYVHGQTTNTAQAVRKTADQVRADLEHLRRIEAQILAESEAKDKELARIRLARKRLEPQATYKPTAHALAYWEANRETVAQMPAQWGGQHNLYLASLEAANWDRDHRRSKAA